MTGTTKLVVVFLLAIIVVVTMANILIGRKNRVSFAFASIDAQLRKRYDLIPNLVAVAERYLQYERSILSELTGLRARAADGTPGDDERVELDNKLTNSLRALFAVAENYPGLKASEPFIHLQRSLNEVEEQLAASRRAYNAAVTDYNNACEMFPMSLVASLMGYRTKPWFEVPSEERQPVRVYR